ncbi:MAG: hypothetical protein M1826_000157 [Phylliscum demangeonii]|nr:MAG: hypothetical protein M1826_000157 [Phylliscum demangeonii]
MADDTTPASSASSAEETNSDGASGEPGPAVVVPAPAPAPASAPAPAAAVTAVPAAVSRRPSATYAQQARAQLSQYVQQADGQIAHLSRALSTPAGTDTVLLATHYGLLVLVQLLERFDQRQRRRMLSRAAWLLAKEARSLRPGETLIATITDHASPPTTTTMTTPTATTAGRRQPRTRQVRALAALIADVRIFHRLWGLLAIWRGAATAFRSPAADGVVRGLVAAQIVASLASQALENAAYLASHRVVRWTKPRQDRAWRWSARFWALHVLLDLLRLWRLRVVGMSASVPASASLPLASELSEKEPAAKELGPVRASDDAELREWWRQLYVDLAYAPLTVHWSVPPHGVVSQLAVGLLGSVVGALQMKQLWRETV